MSPTVRKLATYGLSVYHLAPVSIRHPSRAENVDAWDAGIYAPTLTIVGFATPGQFYEALSEGALTDGFLGRHIVLATNSTRDLQEPECGTRYAPDAVVHWVKSVEGILPPSLVVPGSVLADPDAPPSIEPPEPLEIAWDGEAQDSFRELAKGADIAAHEAIGAGRETAAAMLRRLPGQTMSIALVLSCGEAKELELAKIRRRHIDMAYTVSRWSADHLSWKLRRGIAQDDVGRALQDVCETIERRAPGKVYRSTFTGRVKIAPHLGRVWPLIQANPRYVSTEKWAQVREGETG